MAELIGGTRWTTRTDAETFHTKLITLICRRMGTIAYVPRDNVKGGQYTHAMLMHVQVQSIVSFCCRADIR